MTIAVKGSARGRAKRNMTSTVSILAFAAAAAMATGANAASSNYEYGSQPNMGQIQVTKPLHDAFYTAYIAPSPSASKVVVAILDGLADYTHVDLKGHETDVTVYAGTYRRFDDHATHVSGIIGAAQNGIGVVGVDPFSTLLNIPVFDQRGWVATDLGKKALDYAAAQSARVVNMSYGSTTKGAIFLPGELNLFKNYNSTTPGKGMLIVRAGGNDGVNALNQSFTGDAASLLSNLLLVGSVNSSNVISTFSNRPGNACIGGTLTSCTAGNSNAMMNFWLVAPGENILSDLPGNYLGYMSGTSMATPHVVGAAALVFQKALAGNTQLTPGQVADILKKSADDLGAPGVDPVYGWGLLDVARALNPVGGTYFPTGGASTSGLVAMTSTTVSGSSVVKSGALQNALSNIIVLDGYGRAFTVEQPKIAQASSLVTTDFVQALAGTVASVTTELGGDENASLSLTSSGDLTRGGMRVVSFRNGDMRIDAGLVGSGAYFTAPGSALAGNRESFSRTMAQDFYTGSGNVANWLNQSVFFGADMKTSSRWTLSGLYLRTTAVTNFSYVPDNIAAALMAHNPATSAVVKFGANYQASQSLSGGVYTGVLTEQGQTLGMHTGGAFSLGDGTTYIGGVNVKADLTDSTSLTAFAEQSATSSFANQNSLLSTDTWRGSKYGLSLTQNGLLGISGIFRMTLVRPWQIDQGAILAHVPVGRELDGTIDYQDHMVSVASGNMPLELGLAYLAGGAAFKYGAELKMLDHSLASAQGAPEVSLAAALHWSF